MSVSHSSSFFLSFLLSCLSYPDAGDDDNLGKRQSDLNDDPGRGGWRRSRTARRTPVADGDGSEDGGCGRGRRRGPRSRPAGTAQRAACAEDGSGRGQHGGRRSQPGTARRAAVAAGDDTEDGGGRGQ
uniref:BKRF1 encodes EBNA-1 protein-like n=1 Tax=Oryza rufipogon TaxID=4529 RepID=A0A0E0NMB7_ORYRU